MHGAKVSLDELLTDHLPKKNPVRIESKIHYLSSCFMLRRVHNNNNNNNNNNTVGIHQHADLTAQMPIIKLAQGHK